MNTQYSEIDLVRTMLNTPPFIEKCITVAISISNKSTLASSDYSVTDYTDTYGLKDCYYIDDNSAVLFFKGKKHAVKSKTDKNKITLKGISIPPRESVIVFYRLHKLTD